MSTFFERNKKKSTLAALLLLLKRGKGVVAILILVAILSGIFVLPGGMRVPWADKLAGRMGFATREGDARYAGISQALNAARQHDAEFGIGGWGRRLLQRSYNNSSPQSSSAELVVGKLPKGGADSDAHLGNPQSVAGIPRPEDVNKREDALQLSKDEFLGGLVKSANAAAMAGGGPMGELGAGSDGGKLADGGQMARNLEMASASNPGDGMLQRQLGFQSVPQAGPASQLPKKVAGGKVEKLTNYGLNNSINNMYQPGWQGGKPTFYVLAEARAYSVTAAQPTCSDANGCPKEYASTTSGMMFDGTRCQDTNSCSILSNSEFGDQTTPITPTQNQIAPIINESTKYFDDTKACDDADQWANGHTDPGGTATAAEGMTVQQKCCPGGNPDCTEQGLMRQMQHLSCIMKANKGNAVDPATVGGCGNGACVADGACTESDKTANALGVDTACIGPCDSGSCNADQAKCCKRVGNAMKDVCNKLNCVYSEKNRLCPLAKSQPPDLHDCSQ